MTYQNLKLLNKELLKRKFIINFDINNQIICNKINKFDSNIKYLIKNYDLRIKRKFLNLTLLNENCSTIKLIKLENSNYGIIEFVKKISELYYFEKEDFFNLPLYFKYKY